MINQKKELEALQDLIDYSNLTTTDSEDVKERDAAVQIIRDALSRYDKQAKDIEILKVPLYHIRGNCFDDSEYASLIDGALDQVSKVEK